MLGPMYIKCSCSLFVDKVVFGLEFTFSLYLGVYFNTLGKPCLRKEDSGVV